MKTLQHFSSFHSRHMLPHKRIPIFVSPQSQQKRSSRRKEFKKSVKYVCLMPKHRISPPDAASSLTLSTKHARPHPKTLIKQKSCNSSKKTFIQFSSLFLIQENLFLSTILCVVEFLRRETADKKILFIIQENPFNGCTEEKIYMH